MFARVGIFLAEFKNTIVVPCISIIQLRPGVTVIPTIVSEVYPYEEVEKGIRPGVVELRRVVVGYRTTDYVQISSGLREGELVIIEAQGKVKDGTKVKVVGVEESTL